MDLNILSVIITSVGTVLSSLIAAVAMVKVAQQNIVKTESNSKVRRQLNWKIAIIFLLVYTVVISFSSIKIYTYLSKYKTEALVTDTSICTKKLEKGKENIPTIKEKNKLKKENDNIIIQPPINNIDTIFVRGIVTDKETETPLKDVSVYYYKNERKVEATTNNEGEYKLPFYIRNRNYYSIKINFSLQGYENDDDNVSLSTDKKLNMYLSKK